MNQSPNLNRSWEESQQIIKDLENEISAKQAEITQLKAQQEVKSCRCHIIDPAKIRVLLWINRSKVGKPETATLKIGEQRLLGLPRSDRRGETYFRFDEIMEKKLEVKEPQVSFKCDNCKAEAVVIGSDNPAEELRQREALKKELAQMESVENKSETSKVQGEKVEPKTKESNSTRQALKEQIQQAIKENQQAEQNKETNATQ